MKKLSSSIVVLILVTIIWFAARHKKAAAPSVGIPNQQTGQTNQTRQTGAEQQDSNRPFIAPITNASARTTKKLFGTYVTPQNSPVQPERFTGYHTGTDFVIFPEEQNADVAVNVICDGKFLVKKFASGYGGVAVQACNLNGTAVTIVYGHLRLSSITPALGQTLRAGDHLGMLGTGYSSETDGERKHLHLGIHKGSAINILGYVQHKSQLEGWVDPLTVIRK